MNSKLVIPSIAISLLILSACAKQFDSKQVDPAAKPGQTQGRQQKGSGKNPQGGSTTATTVTTSTSTTTSTLATSDNSNNANPSSSAPRMSGVQSGSSSTAGNPQGQASGNSGSAGTGSPTGQAQTNDQQQQPRPPAQSIDENKLKRTAWYVHKMLKERRQVDLNDQLQACDVSIESGDGLFSTTTWTNITCDGTIHLSESRMQMDTVEHIQGEVRHVIRFHMNELGLFCDKAEHSQHDDNMGMLTMKTVRCEFQRKNP